MEQQYIFKDTPYSTNQQKYICVYYSLQKEIQKLANKLSVNIEFQDQIFSLKITSNNTSIKTIIKTLDLFEIIFYKTNSNFEALSIYFNLRQEQNKKLNNTLDCHLVKPFLLDKVDFQLFPKQIFPNIGNEYLILIFQNEKNQKVEDIEKQFSNYIKENFELRVYNDLSYHRDQFILIKESLQELLDQQKLIQAKFIEVGSDFQIQFSIVIDKNNPNEMMVKQLQNQILSKFKERKGTISSIFPKKKDTQSMITNPCFIILKKFDDEIKKDVQLFLSQKFKKSSFQEDQNIIKMFFRGDEKNQDKEEAEKVILNMKHIQIEFQSQEIDFSIVSKQELGQFIKNSIFQFKIEIHFIQFDKIRKLFSFLIVDDYQKEQEIKNQILKILKSIQKVPQLKNQQLYNNPQELQKFCVQHNFFIVQDFLYGNQNKFKEIESELILNEPTKSIIIKTLGSQTVVTETNNKSNIIIGENSFSIYSEAMKFFIQKYLVDFGIIIKFVQKQDYQIIIKNGSLQSEKCKLVVIVNKDFESYAKDNYMNDLCHSYLAQEECSKLLQIVQNDFMKFKEDQHYMYYIKSLNQYVMILANPNLYENEEQCFSMIEKNIKKVFEFAKEKVLDTIVMPVFGCGPCDVSFTDVSDKILNSIISNMDSQQNVKKVVIVDSYIKRVKKFILNAISIVVPSNYQAPLFNWRVDGKTYNKQINGLIDKAFDNFVHNGVQSKIQIPVSFFSLKPTHRIDLIKNKIYDLQTGKVETLEGTFEKMLFKYQINNEPVEERKNNLLNLLLRYNCKECEVSFQEVQVIFDYEKNIYQQIGQEIKPITKTILLQDYKYFQKFNIIISPQDNVEVKQELNPLINSNYGTFISFSKFQSEINDSAIPHNKQVLNNSIDQTAQNLIDYLSNQQPSQDETYQKILDVTENINQQNLKQPNLFLVGQNLKLCLPNKAYINKKFKELIKIFFETRTNYNTIQNVLNLKKIEKNEKQFQLIEKLLTTAEVLEIFHIQNQKLYEQFENSKNRLINQNNLTNNKLEKSEEQCVLLACIDSHPKYSYDSESKGIQILNGQWGQGVYFSKILDEKCMYKIDENSNEFLALLCLVVTGRSLILQPDQQNATYSIDYSGYDSGTNLDRTIIFIHQSYFGRAYPQYQIRFRLKE